MLREPPWSRLLAAGNLLDGASVDDLTLATTDLLWAGMVAGVPAPHGSLPDRA